MSWEGLRREWPLPKTCSVLGPVGVQKPSVCQPQSWATEATVLLEAHGESGHIIQPHGREARRLGEESE